MSDVQQPPSPAIPGLLARPPREAVRMVALLQVDAAEMAFRRLTGDRDNEALHDFRVALRRLRSVLRAYGPLFEDSVRPLLTGRLRRLARATGKSRDMEVREQALAELAVELPEADAPGADWLSDRLQRNRRRADERTLTRVEREFPRLLRRLQEALGSYTATVPPPGMDMPSFANAVALQLELHSAALIARLAAMDGTEDVRDVHAARLEAKRLRYLVEPLVHHVPGADECVQRLKRLQDATGDLHDADILLDWLEARQAEVMEEPDAAASAAADGSELSAAADDDSLTVADRGNRELRGRVIARMADVVRGQRDRLWLDLHSATAEFAAAADVLPLVEALLSGEMPVERERKYLLSGLPPAAELAESVYVEQGYLPGEVLVERLRREVDGDETRRWRTVKVGTGLSRIELEEPCDTGLFEALWPFTTGRRVSKRRFTVREANESGAWEVDSFTDRDLVLAEYELHGAGDQVVIPDWLAPYVVREVTGERDYVNAVLAK